MEEDKEMLELKKIRDELMERVLDLRDKLSEQQKAAKSRKKIIDINKIDDTLHQVTKDNEIEEDFITKLMKLSQNALGITYKNVNKKWLKDNIWLYQFRVIMKTLSFNVDLTVNQENDMNKIEDITCHFLEMDSNLLQEISSWVQSLTRIRNFSFLMFAFSQYNEKSIHRKKILNKLVAEKFVTIDKYFEYGGGMIVYIHSPKAIMKHYAEYSWKLQFNPKTRSIEHCFVIEATDNDFVNSNRNLIENFCKNGLTKNALEKLWEDLCFAISEHE